MNEKDATTDGGVSVSQQQVLEGTWEEILLHAEELAGAQISLTILVPGTKAGGRTNGSKENNEHRFDTILESLFQESETIEAEPGKPGSDVNEAAFGEIIMDKYRKQSAGN